LRTPLGESPTAPRFKPPPSLSFRGTLSEANSADSSYGSSEERDRLMSLLRLNSKLFPHIGEAEEEDDDYEYGRLSYSHVILVSFFFCDFQKDEISVFFFL
jgi:hypothetical protein